MRCTAGTSCQGQWEGTQGSSGLPLGPAHCGPPAAPLSPGLPYISESPASPDIW